MSKRMLDWSIKNAIMTMAEYMGKDLMSKMLAEFDIALLYPEFEKMNDVQKFIIEYGIKQKLADSGSSDTGDVKAKTEVAKTKWQDWLDGKVTGVRLNATGAKANKAFVEKGKEVSKVVSLEGLICKKQLFPDTFTEEDQVKLDEFLVLVAKSKSKK